MALCRLFRRRSRLRSVGEANTTLPVTVTQLASFHNQFANRPPKPPFVRLLPAGKGTTGSSPTSGNGRPLFPTIKGSTTKIARQLQHDRNLRLQPRRRDEPGFPEHRRPRPGSFGPLCPFYPLRDSAGNIVPNTYLVVMDYEGGPTTTPTSRTISILSATFTGG